ncbi:hypothetical protein [Vibrio mediterranei]|uniref:hypothetical protein n=1 Tax=Vibrio mediterranei TaxID=689 RepID=UPI0040676642
MKQPFETYTSQDLLGDHICLELFGEIGGVTKATIGGRFDDDIVMRIDCNEDTIKSVFDFFNNYACLLTRSELKKGWKAYQKSRSQSWFDEREAFWNYFEGRKIVPAARKWACVTWS